MKIAYFDCFAGIAGDMALAALLDCGVPLDELRAALSSLPVEGWELETKPILKSGIHALKVRISLHGQSDDEERMHDHHHDHHHDSDHAHDHHGASMADIRQLIEKSTLSDRVKQTSLAIFEKIAIAEAHQHHTTPDKVHFHEIGGVDSLLDICGVAWCLEYLGIEKIYASRLPLSSGFVDCAHGRMPVPAPAVMELLRGIPVYSSGLEGEMITPTGAGILAALCDDFGEAPAMVIAQIGCGSGTREWPDRPNLLRVTLGESIEEDKSTFIAGLEHQHLKVLQTNIDDLNPQLYDDVCDKLWQAGALDVWLQNVQMKKNRPAVKVSVLCENEQMDSVLKVLLLQTTSLGVRINEVQRLSLKRRMSKVATRFGEIAVKLALDEQGKILRGQPEYDEMRELAHQHNVPLQEIESAAKTAINGRFLNKGI